MDEGRERPGRVNPFPLQDGMHCRCANDDTIRRMYAHAGYCYHDDPDTYRKLNPTDPENIGNRTSTT